MRIFRTRRFWVIALLALFLLSVVAGYYLVTRAPEQLPEAVGPVRVQEFALTNGFTGDVAKQNYLAWFLTQEELFEEWLDEQTRSKGGSIGPLQFLGGPTRRVIISVTYGDETQGDIQPAVNQAKLGDLLIKELYDDAYPNLQPALSFTYEEYQVRIDVDPAEVSEEVWQKAVANELGLGCGNSNPWDCIADWSQSKRQFGEQAIIFSLHTVEMPLLPSSGTPIDGYARLGGFVSSAKSGFVSAGIGAEFNAHEMLHSYAVRHPGHPLSILGYWGKLNEDRHDLMKQISSSLISIISFEIAGVRDANSNGISDIHETSFSFTQLDVDEFGVSGRVIDEPAPPSPMSNWQVHNVHRVTAVEVRVNGGQWKLATPVDVDWGEHWNIEFSFDANIDTNRLNRIEVRATTDFPQFAPMITETIYIGKGGYSSYLPLIFND